MILGFGPGRGRFGGLTSKCLGRLGGNSPSWRNRTAFPRIAERRRCNRLAICEAECVGHKVTSSRSSSSVQRDMAGLGHPAPGAMPADSCGIILAIASLRAGASQAFCEFYGFGSGTRAGFGALGIHSRNAGITPTPDSYF